jgi:hypothetical protein
MLEDGIYGLRFAASHDGEPADGSGLAVLRDGKVLGSDPLGAVFTGTYEFDAARKLNKVRLRLDVPPDGVLVTGFSAGRRAPRWTSPAHFPGRRPTRRPSSRLPARPSGCRSGILGRCPTDLAINGW